MTQGILESIAVDRIHTTDERFMPRQIDTTSDRYQKIKTGIKERGLMNAIAVVRLPNGNFKLKDGLRRVTAHKELGYTHINATVFEDDASETEVDFLADGLLANLAREDMTKKEKANAYRTLIDEGRFTAPELADRTGVSTGHIYQLMGILKLPEECQKLIDKGVMPLGNATRLVSCVRFAPPASWWKTWQENACTMKQIDFKTELDASVQVMKEEIKEGKKAEGKVTGPNPKCRTQGDLLTEFNSLVEELPRDEDGFTDTSSLSDFQRGQVERMKWVVQQDDESVQAWHDKKAEAEAKKAAKKQAAIEAALSEEE